MTSLRNIMDGTASQDENLAQLSKYLSPYVTLGFRKKIELKSEDT